MIAVLVDGLLALAVACAWIGAIGFARLRSPLDRLHCAAFVNVGAGVPVVIAAFLQDGPSPRAFKLLLLVVAALLAGAAFNQAAARAVVSRDEAGEQA